LRSKGIALAALIVLGVAYLELVGRLTGRIDDVYITLRYAKNFADGHGLVFNVGERVEGYTCFLWVVLLAAVRHLGFDIVEACGVISAAFGLLTLPVTYAGARALRVSRPAALVAPAILALSPSYAFWAGSGMETLPATFLLALALWLYLRRQDSLWVPAVLALAVLTRPDAVVAAAVIGFERLLYWRGGRGFWRWGASFLIIFAPYYAWRYAYYGYPLPNTFYAKVGSGMAQYERGWDYFLMFFRGSGAIAWFTLALIGVWARRTRTTWTVLGIGLAFWAYVVGVGGDVFGLHRFFIPALPAWGILAAIGIEHLAAVAIAAQRSLVRRASAAAIIFAAVTVFAIGTQRELHTPVWKWPMLIALRTRPGGVFGGGPHPPRTNAMTLSARMREAQELRAHCQPGETIAASAIGVVGYYTNLRIVDMLGLVDVHIAHRKMPGVGRFLPGHEKFDSKYVLSRKPAYILMAPPVSAKWSALPAERNMWANPEFHRDYQWAGWAYRRVRR